MKKRNRFIAYIYSKKQTNYSLLLESQDGSGWYIENQKLERWHHSFYDNQSKSPKTAYYAMVKSFIPQGGLMLS